MGYEAAAQKQMLRLFVLFEPHVDDSKLHSSSAAIIADRAKWNQAHGQFTQVRQRMLKIEKKGIDRRAGYHLSFLEEALKTVFNESRSNAPFDSISPFFVVPLALQLASEIGLPLSEVRDACSYS